MPGGDLVDLQDWLPSETIGSATNFTISHSGVIIGLGRETRCAARIDFYSDFTEQMLEYAGCYAYLPVLNF
jgi:hypothetical protein